MIRTSVSIPLLACLSGILWGQDRDIKELADRLAGQAAAANRKVIAVVPFTKDGTCPAFGDFIANRLSILLVDDSKQQFQIVTRNRVNELLREVQLKNARGFNEKTFTELGKLAGADTIVSGDITVFGNKLNVDAQLLDVATGRILAGHFVEIPKTADLDAALNPRDCPGAGTRQSPTEIANGDAKTEDTSKTGTFGPLRKQPGNRRIGEFRFGSGGWEAAEFGEHCENQSGKLLCVLAHQMFRGTMWFLPPKPENTTMVDNRGETHKLLAGYYLNQAGEPIENTPPMNPGDILWVVLEYYAPKPISSVTLSANDTTGYVRPYAREIRNIPVE